MGPFVPYEIAWSVALLVLIPLLVVALVQIARHPTLSAPRQGRLGAPGPFLGLAAWFVFKPARGVDVG